MKKGRYLPKLGWELIRFLRQTCPPSSRICEEGC